MSRTETMRAFMEAMERGAARSGDVTGETEARRRRLCEYEIYRVGGGELEYWPWLVKYLGGRIEGDGELLGEESFSSLACERPQGSETSETMVTTRAQEMAEVMRKPCACACAPRTPLEQDAAGGYIWGPDDDGADLLAELEAKEKPVEVKSSRTGRDWCAEAVMVVVLVVGVMVFMMAAQTPEGGKAVKVRVLREVMALSDEADLEGDRCEHGAEVEMMGSMPMVRLVLPYRCEHRRPFDSEVWLPGRLDPVGAPLRLANEEGYVTGGPRVTLLGGEPEESGTVGAVWAIVVVWLIVLTGVRLRRLFLQMLAEGGKKKQ